MKKFTYTLPFFIFLLFLSLNLHAHTFTGMSGFYDGIRHPVLGTDHFIAMISVGILSALIGGRAIWTMPATFLGTMIIGGIIGIAAEITSNIILYETTLSQNMMYYLLFVIEFGIILSVIFLGLSIAIEKKISSYIIFAFVSFFGLCHGTAHGIEMPWAANPFLFSLGFTSGTAILHLFGVGIGSVFNKSKTSNFIIRIIGLIFSIYGFYLLF